MRTIAVIAITALAAIFFLFAPHRNSNNSRLPELDHILSKLQKPPIETDSYQEGPGWSDPKNREALEAFIAKYPNTEEALLGEVWLIFAQQNTIIRNPVAEKSRRIEDAKILKSIISTTKKPGTAKIAMIQRTGALSAAENYSELENQINEIIASIEDFKQEKDDQFLTYLKINQTRASGLEAAMLHELIVMECHQYRLNAALLRAQKLKLTFPEWSKWNHVQGFINQLKKGQSPYPKHPEQFKL